MGFLFNYKIKILIFLSIAIVATAAVVFYLRINYQKLDRGIDSIKIVLNEPIKLDAPIFYLTDSAEVAPNFQKVIVSNPIGDSILIISLERKIKLRQFRLYFIRPVENVQFKEILLRSGRNEFKLDLEKLSSEEIQTVNGVGGNLKFNVLSANGFAHFKSPRFYYSTDRNHILIATILIIFLLYFLFLLVIETKLVLNPNSISISELGVAAFILSILLPQRYFNIAFIVSFILVLKNFNLKFFFTNKVNLIFLSFYLLILIDFFVISPDYNFKSIEKYTLFLVLPIYASCIRSRILLVAFFMSALVIGSGLLAGALIDISIFKNPEIISFDNFTRSIHPVYYSYLLVFSILYVEFTLFSKCKYLVQLLLILLLILSGSKLIVFLTILWFAFFVKRSVGVIVVLITILVFTFFTPITKRFVSIINPTDLTIISEDHIQDPDDPRLNGITIRIILWQESLRINAVSDFLFGKGVSESGTKAFKSNLEQRGLVNHLAYNAHNQYMSTLFKTGLVGLILLLTMLIYCIKFGLRHSNVMFVFFMLMMSLSMLSESVFERASGIAFFSMVILLVTNSKLWDDGILSPVNEKNKPVN